MNFEILRDVVFGKVWNNVFLAQRANIKPNILSKRSMKGMYTRHGLSFSLPTNDLFYIFSIPFHLTAAFSIPNDTWVNGEDLCNDYDTLLHIFSRTGKMAHKKSTYVRKLSQYGVYVIAVEKKVTNFMVKPEDIDSLFVSVYVDCDRLGTVTSKTVYVSNSDPHLTERNKIYELVANNNVRSVLVNGEYVDSSTITTAVKENDVVDVLIDKDVQISFDVDMTDPNYDYRYRSEEDKIYRQIIHVPKSLNSNNSVITHDTVEIIAFEKLDDGTLGKGRYLHYAQDLDKSIVNITHNDFGVPVYVLDALRDYLKNDNLVLRVLCKTHTSDNNLIRDANFIDELYRWHEDLKIIEILASKVPDVPYYWKANHLESSTYVKMFFDTPNGSVEKNLSKYIDAIGYYHTLSILCKRVCHFTIDDAFKGAFVVQKPAAYEGKSVYPVVSIAGRKIRGIDVTYVDEENSMVISLSDELLYKTGDSLTVELFVDEASRKNNFAPVYRLTPDVDKPSLIIPYQEYVVYEQIDIGLVEAKGVDRSTNYVFREITDKTGLIIEQVLPNGKKSLQFARSMHGRTFVVQCKSSIYYQYEQIDEKMNSGDPLAFTLTRYNLNPSNQEMDEVEVLTVKKPIVYLNGHYLVYGIDFILANIEKLDGVAMQQVIISNAEYLMEENNFVEIIGVNASIEDMYAGFTKNSTIISDKPTSIFFESISTIHTDGLIQTSVDIHPDKLVLPSGSCREGAIYGLRTSVPYEVKEFMDKHHKNEDTEKLKILSEYLNDVIQDEEEVVFIHHSHKVYSIHLAMLVRDIASGDFPGVGLDPDKERMLEQIKKYEHLLELDPAHLYGDAFDLNYIDILPVYRLTYVRPDQVVALRELAKQLLPKDRLRFGKLKTHV